MHIARIILLFMLVLPGQSQAGRAIFYQPQLRDVSVETSHWPLIFGKVYEQGIDTLIVQWTAHGDVFNSKENQTWLKNRLEDAVQSGLSLIIGLDADPDLFTRLEQPVTVLNDYFRKQRRRDADLAQYWLNTLPNHKISGWYVTLEIDDRRWRDSSALALLTEHLLSEEKLLNGIGNKPVYISSFFAGNTEPVHYAKMLSQLKQETKINILVQDGAGTAKLSERERSLYLNFLSDCQSPVADGIVYEIFRQTRHDQEFQAEALAPKKLLESLKKRAPCGKETVLFSLRYLIDLNNPR